MFLFSSSDDATDVTIFILDTGVLFTHDEFTNGRVSFYNDTVTPNVSIILTKPPLYVYHAYCEGNIILGSRPKVKNRGWRNPWNIGLKSYAPPPLTKKSLLTLLK